MKTKQQSISIEEYKNLSKDKAPRKQPEGINQRVFGEMLNGIYKHKLSPNLIYWTYSGAGEKKPLRTAVNQKRKGLQRGDPDYRFEIKEIEEVCESIIPGSGIIYSLTRYIQRIVYIEFKSQAGSLSKEQKEFFKKHEGLENVKCYIAKSPEEGIKILIQEGIVI